jgi:hypothetical protein
MAKIFISSGVSEPGEYQDAVIDTLRKLGHDALFNPLEPRNDKAWRGLVRAQIATCDAVLLIVGWKNAAGLKYVYDHAARLHKPTLGFLAAEQAGWPASQVASGPRFEAVRTFRDQLHRERLAPTFTTPADLANAVTAAVALLERRPTNTSQRTLDTSAPGVDLNTSPPSTDSDSSVPSEAGDTSPPDTQGDTQPPPGIPPNVDKFELAWRLVVSFKAEPAILGHMDPTALEASFTASSF